MPAHTAGCPKLRLPASNQRLPTNAKPRPNSGYLIVAVVACGAAPHGMWHVRHDRGWHAYRALAVHGGLEASCPVPQ